MERSSFMQSLADLKARGVRLTPQRQMILRYLKETHEHPTADQVYNFVCQEFNGISMTATTRNTPIWCASRAGKWLTCPARRSRKWAWRTWPLRTTMRFSPTVWNITACAQPAARHRTEERPSAIERGGRFFVRGKGKHERRAALDRKEEGPDEKAKTQDARSGEGDHLFHPRVRTARCRFSALAAVAEASLVSKQPCASSGEAQGCLHCFIPIPS